MYAIVKTGGKQYRVERGQTLLVERLPAAEGADVALEPIMLRGSEVVVDADALKRASVTARVIAHERGEKLRPGLARPESAHRKPPKHRRR